MATLTQMVKEQDEIVPTRPYTSTKDIYNGKKSDFQFFVGTNFSVFFSLFFKEYNFMSCSFYINITRRRQKTEEDTF